MRNVSVVFAASFVVLTLIVVSALNCVGAPTPAETPEAFYKGKTGAILVHVRPGTTFDLIARLLAPHLKQYTGATWVIRHMTAGGGMGAANYLYKRAKPDGLTIYICSSNLTIAPFMARAPEVKYDLKHFTYLGAVDRAWHGLNIRANLPYKSLSEMVTSGRTFKFTAGSRGNFSYWHTLLALAPLGLKAKVLTGYTGGSAEQTRALLGGEADAHTLSSRSVRPYVKSGGLRIICFYTRERDPGSPDVPTIYETIDLPRESEIWSSLADDMDKVNRAFIAPPGVPADRAEFLRAALGKGMKQKNVIDSMIARGASPIWVPGEELKKAYFGYTKLTKKQLDMFRNTYAEFGK